MAARDFGGRVGGRGSSPDALSDPSENGKAARTSRLPGSRFCGVARSTRPLEGLRSDTWGARPREEAGEVAKLGGRGPHSRRGARRELGDWAEAGGRGPRVVEATSEPTDSAIEAARGEETAVSPSPRHERSLRSSRWRLQTAAPEEATPDRGGR